MMRPDLRCLHHRDCGPREEKEGALDVGVEQHVERGLVNSLDWQPEAADAGIVNEDVDQSLQTKDLRDRVLDLRRRCDCGLEAGDVAYPPYREGSRAASGNPVRIVVDDDAFAPGDGAGSTASARPMATPRR